MDISACRVSESSLKWIMMSGVTDGWTAEDGQRNTHQCLMVSQSHSTPSTSLSLLPVARGPQVWGQVSPWDTTHAALWNFPVRVCKSTLLTQRLCQRGWQSQDGVSDGLSELTGHKHPCPTLLPPAHTSTSSTEPSTGTLVGHCRISQWQVCSPIIVFPSHNGEKKRLCLWIIIVIIFPLLLAQRKWILLQNSAVRLYQFLLWMPLPKKKRERGYWRTRERQVIANKIHSVVLKIPEEKENQALYTLAHKLPHASPIHVTRKGEILKVWVFSHVTILPVKSSESTAQRSCTSSEKNPQFPVPYHRWLRRHNS